MNFERRTFLKGIGAVGIAGAGLTLASGGASATASVQINSDDVEATTNDGEVRTVGVSPKVVVDWEGFDDPVGKVFFLVEAADASGTWWPIFRATPWLTEELFDGNGNLVQAPGESGRATIDFSVDGFRQALIERSGNGVDNSTQAADVVQSPVITIFDGQGRPDYQSWNFPTSYDGYINGNSIGSASTYSKDQGTVPQSGLEPQNNYPESDAGYYGAADTTDHLNEEEDGASNAEDGIEVNLRYTVVLYGINGSEAGYMDYGNFVEEKTRRELTTTDWNGSQSTFAQHLNITEDQSGNSALVMNGEDGYPDITQEGANTPASKYYPALNAVSGSHPAVTVVDSSFNATVTNKEATTDGVSGDSNTTMT